MHTYLEVSFKLPPDFLHISTKALLPLQLVIGLSDSVLQLGFELGEPAGLVLLALQASSQFLKKEGNKVGRLIT